MYNLGQENRKMKLDNVFNAVSKNIAHLKNIYIYIISGQRN